MTLYQVRTLTARPSELGPGKYSVTDPREQAELLQRHRQQQAQNNVDKAG